MNDPTVTLAEVTPVTEFDTSSIGSGRIGSVTHTIQQAFFTTVSGEGPHSKKCLDYAKSPSIAAVEKV
jgi:branched-chain amino acid aminotransferase